MYSFENYFQVTFTTYIIFYTFNPKTFQCWHDETLFKFATVN